MSNKYCRRCRNSNFGQCKHGYRKTEEQIIRENYDCFKERINIVDLTIRHPDIEYAVYQDEINYKQTMLHIQMKRAERALRKS